MHYSHFPVFLVFLVPLWSSTSGWNAWRCPSQPSHEPQLQRHAMASSASYTCQWNLDKMTAHSKPEACLKGSWYRVERVLDRWFIRLCETLINLTRPRFLSLTFLRMFRCIYIPGLLKFLPGYRQSKLNGEPNRIWNGIVWNRTPLSFSTFLLLFFLI